MGRIVAFTNSKGGVGKSTLAVHLAIWLKGRGCRVALIDSDVQRSSSRWLGEFECDLPVRTLYTPDEILEQAQELRSRHDYVVADGPAGLAEQTRALLLVADLAIIPVGPSALDLHAAEQAVRVLKQAQAIRAGLPKACLVLNRLQPRTRLGREAIEALKLFGIPLARHSVHLRTSIADASGQGTVVWQMGVAARDAARELHGLFHEVMGDGEAHLGRDVERTGPAIPGRRPRAGERNSRAEPGAASAQGVRRVRESLAHRILERGRQGPAPSTRAATAANGLGAGGDPERR